MTDILINNFSNEKVGSIQISEEVISVIAGTACVEVEDVVSLAGTGISSTGLIEMISKKNLAKGVEIKMLDEGIEVNVNLILKLGSNISKTADKVQDKVKNAVESMTNLSVKKVNVNIGDLREVV